MAQKTTVKRTVKSKKRTNKSGKSKTSPTAKFLSKSPAAVRKELADTVVLPTFRGLADRLTKLDRLRIVEQALVLMESNYVHLPLKEAMHATSPIQNLRLLEDQIQNTPASEMPDEQVFHRTMISIFMSVRDLHTNYLLPNPYNRMTAFVPFLIEDYFEDGQRRYIVSHVMTGFGDPPFETGVEVISWNGIPINRAVEINGDRFAGSNLEARRARGIKTMTVRPLIMSLPPDEDRVIMEYRIADGEIHELRTPWLVFQPGTGFGEADAQLDSAIEAAQGIDIELDMCHQARKFLFAPKVVEAEKRIAARGDSTPANMGLMSMMPNVFQARPVNTPSGTFGYIRIRTFSVNNADAFVNEFVRLVRQLPREGLIIDVRENGGGLIWAGEQLLQTLTPRTIEPEPVQFINTSLNLQLCERNEFLGEWTDSIRQSVRTGSIFSRGFPITTRAQCNNIGQQYHGPVVLVTDALCYSTTDIFAAGFQDHNVGIILGVDGNTGAGGANVWTHNLLRLFYPQSETGSPYRPLPNGSGMRVSIRRTIRVNDMAGTPVEDLGVVPDLQYDMTREDLLDSNVDLINHAGEILADMPVRMLEVELSTVSPSTIVVNATTQGLDRLDVLVNGRPVGSEDISDGETEITITAESVDVLEFDGFKDDRLRASKRLFV